MEAFFGNPNVQRQGQKARELAAARDVNTMPDPQTYSFVSGLLGTAPDQQGFSAMHPKAADIRSAGEKGLAMSILAQFAPVTKGLPVGASIKAYPQGGKMGDAPARMSRAESEAAGYWHPIGDGKKLPIPFGDMTAEREVVRNLRPREIISPERLQGGVLVPASGDRTIAGQNLLGMNGRKFETPVLLEGGPDFMRTHSPEAVWASDKGAISGLSNRIRTASEISPDVYMPYVAMGHGSANFNTMMTDALLEQVKTGKIAKKDIKAFDGALRAERPEWAGLLNSGSRAHLDDNGALRHAFVNRMQLDEFQNAGFPNIANTRFAITEPSLLDAPLHSSGFAISKVDPTGRIVSNPTSPHKTYNTQLAGEYVGGFQEQVPRSVMFPDWFKSRRSGGFPESADPRSFQLANPIQPANQEWLDGVMRHLEAGRAFP